MRRRLLALTVGPALLAVLLLATPLGVFAGRYYVRDERLELEQAAATTAANLRGDTIGAAIPAGLRAGREIELSVYDATARRLRGAGPADGGPLVRDALRGRPRGTTTATRIEVAAPVSDGDRVVAVVLLTTSLDAAHARTGRAWLALAGMSLGAVLIAATAVWWFSRRLNRSVAQLTDVASRVGAGDLTARAGANGIGELDALGRTLNGTLDRLDTMLARERALSAEVSHQLRTPVSALRLELEAMHRSSPARPPAGGADDLATLRLAAALDSVGHLESTITDVLSLARDLPAGGRTEIAAALDAAARRWHARLAADSRPLRAIVDPGCPALVTMSRAALGQIIDVLVDNAVVHGEGIVTIRARVAAPGHVAIEVGDEGPGIAIEATTLFIPRSAAEHDRGLGLLFARRLAEAEGGRLVLAADEPPTFRLVAPGAPQEPSPTVGPTRVCSDPER